MPDHFCFLRDIFCCDGQIRLAGGSLSNEGRVEICRSGQWKTVCDNNWRGNEARVVCRQLGFITQGIMAIVCMAISIRAIIMILHRLQNQLLTILCSHH